MHTVDSLVFKEQLIVLGDGDEEEDGRDIFKAVNPLLALRTLATNIEHPVREFTDDEGRLGDTSSLDTRSENILVVGDVVVLSDSADIIEIAEGKESVMKRHKRGMGAGSQLC